MRNNNIYKRVSKKIGIILIAITMVVLVFAFAVSVDVYAEEGDGAGLDDVGNLSNDDTALDDQSFNDNDNDNKADNSPEVSETEDEPESEDESNSKEETDFDEEDGSKTDSGSENQNAIHNENDTPSNGTNSVTELQDVSPKNSASQDFSTDTSTPSLSGTKDPTPPYSVEATEGGYMLVGGDPNKDATENWIVEVDGAQYIVEPGTRMILTGFVPVGDETYYALSSTGKIAVDSNKMYADTDGKYKYVKEGKFTPFTGIVKKHGSSGWFFARDGINDPTFTGLAESSKNGNYYYMIEGVLKDYTFTGLAPKVDEDGYFYTEQGKMVLGYTGLVKKSDELGWFFSNNGVYDPLFNGFANSSKDGNYYLTQNGKYDTAFIGFGKSLKDNKYYFAKNGKINTKFTGLAKSLHAKGYYFARDGVYDNTFTGLAKSAHAEGYYFARKGKYRKSFTGLAKSIKNDQYYFARDGKYDNTFTGFAMNVDDEQYYFARNGKHDDTFTGLAKSIVNDKYYFARNGKYDKTFTGLAKSIKNDYYYYTLKGKYTNNFTGIVRKADEKGWFLAKKGKQNTTYTGLAKSSINDNYYYVRKGKIKDYKFFGLAKKIDEDGYFFARKSVMDLTYTGPAGNIADLKVYHVKNGRPTKVTGTVTANGQTYNVKNGLVVKSKVTINKKKVNVDGKGSFYIKSGWLDFLGEKFYFINKTEKATGANLIDDRQYFFEKNGILSSRTGIDVSEWQGDIDWEKVKADGIDFAFIRVGGRLAISGDVFEDETAIRNLQEASRVGIPVGVYFYTQAITVKEALQEAKLVVDIIKNYKIDLPVVIDSEDYIEKDDNGNIIARGRHTTKITAQERTDIIIAFCDYVKSKGYDPMYYAGYYWCRDYLDVSRLDDKYTHWIAQYYKECEYSGPYKCWQYSEKGRVAGVYGNCDMNIWYENR